MIHRYYSPVQLLALSPILYLTVQKGTPANAGPLKVRGSISSNRSNRPKIGPGDGHDKPFSTKAITIIDNFKKVLGDTDKSQFFRAISINYRR